MKKISLRKCIVTKQMLPKEDLLRICKNSEGKIAFDETYKAPGRGVYIKKEIEVILLAKKKRLLEKALHQSLDESLYKELISALERR